MGLYEKKEIKPIKDDSSFDVDPVLDPTFHFDADPDANPDFYSMAGYADPGYQNDADPE